MVYVQRGKTAELNIMFPNLLMIMRHYELGCISKSFHSSGYGWSRIDKAFWQDRVGEASDMLVLFYMFVLFMSVQRVMVSSHINSNFEATNVVELNAMNHHNILDLTKYTVIEFCNNNLRSCREADEIFFNTAKRLQKERIPVTFAKVDCSEQRELCDLHLAAEQPIVKFYNYGKVEITRYGLNFYHQQRFYNEVKNFTASRVTVLQTSDDLKRYLENSGVLLLGIFKGNCELKNVFLRVANRFRNTFKFAYSDAPEVAAETGYSHKILLYYPKHLANKYEPDRVAYNGKSTDSVFVNFLMQNSTGLAGIRTKENQYIFNRKPLFIVYFNVDYIENAQETKYWRNRVLSVADVYAGKAYFALSNDAVFDQEVEELGLRKNGERLVSEDNKPLVGAFTDNGRYRMESEFSTENLMEFVEGVLNKRIERFSLSEDIVVNSGNFVKVAVRQNFDELVLNSTKNVFLMLFTSICGICRRLSVKFDELDQEFLNQDVVFVKMDVLANDVPIMFANVSKEKPNLYWLSKVQRSHPITYGNDFNIDDIVKFIWSNLRATLDPPKADHKIHSDEL
uniref:protein disulfide-isomerase n=1 Tax=Syphacia muris TaxID=451379 RepID=A0A158R5P5_9BILA